MVWGKCRKKGGPVGGQGGREPRIEVIVKIKKNVGRGSVGAGGGGGVKVVVKEELK